MQSLSPAGLDLIKNSEGFRSSTYKDVSGYPTIGYGHKLRIGESYPNGITEPIADEILSLDVASAARWVGNLVKVPLTQDQFDALVDFVFNLGAGRLATSTLLRDLNAGNYDAVPDQLELWDHGDLNGREVELAALKARRAAEAALWRS